MRISDWISDVCSSDLEPREAPRWMRFPIEILVLICLLVGIIPALTIGPFLATAVQSVLGGRTPTYSLAIWHGFSLPLLMSVIALVGRSEEHTSELQSLMRISYAVFCLKKKKPQRSSA